MVSAQSNVIDKIVARVGNEYILKSEIENMYMQENSGSTTSNADIRAELLEQLLIQKLLCTEAHLDSIDVNVTDVHVQQAIEQRINQMIETIGSKERLEQYFGQTIQELSEDMFPSYRSMLVAEEMQKKIQENMFVGFYTGYIEKVGYGNQTYYSQHPQLTQELIDTLTEKGVAIIGLDFAGIRRGSEHVPADRRCAQKGTFVVENLCNLKTVIDQGGVFTAHTYPMNYVGITGIPCRVIAEMK